MDYKLKRPLLWLGALLIVLPIVHAAGQLDFLPQLLTQLFGENPGDWYTHHARVLDPIFIGIFFWIIFQNILKGTWLKGLGIALAILFAFIFAAFESQRGFTLLALSPIVLILMLMAIGFLVYRMVHGMFQNNSVAFFTALIAVVVLGQAMAISTLRGVGTVFSIMTFIAILGGVWLTFKGLSQLAGRGGSSSARAAPQDNASLYTPQSFSAHTNRARFAVEDFEAVEDAANQDTGAVATDVSETAAAAPVEAAATAVDTRVVADLGVDLTLDARAAQTLSEFRERISKNRGIAQALQQRYRDARNSGASTSELDNYIAEYTAILQQGIQPQQVAFDTIEQDIHTQDAAESDEPLQKQIDDKIESQDVKQFAIKAKIIKDVKNSESVVNAAFEEAKATVLTAPREGWGDGESIIKQFVSKESEYQSHLANVAKLIDLHKEITDETKKLKNCHQQMHAALSERVELRRHQQSAFTNVQQQFRAYWPTLIISLPEKNDAAFNKAQTDATAIISSIDALSHTTNRRIQLGEDIARLIQDAERIEANLRALKPAFDTLAIQVLKDEKELEVAAIAAVIVAEHRKAAIELAPAKGGLGCVGLTATDITKKKQAANIKAAQTAIEKQLDEQVRSKLDASRKKHASSPEGALLTEVAAVCLREVNALRKSWSDHITDITDKAEAARTGGRP
jgi:hypothetical protein